MRRYCKNGSQLTIYGQAVIVRLRQVHSDGGTGDGTPAQAVNMVFSCGKRFENDIMIWKYGTDKTVKSAEQ